MLSNVHQNQIDKYRLEADEFRKNQMSNLVQGGQLTAEQADTAMTATPNGTPSTNQRLESVRSEIEQMYRQTYGERAPSLSDTLTAAAQSPDFSLSAQRNFQETLPKITPEHEAWYEALDP